MPIEKKYEKTQVGRILKTVKSDGPDFLAYVEGYASTKDVDRANEVIEPSAWTASMADYMKFPALLANHVWSNNPIGKVLEYRIDDTGLWVRAGIAPTMAGHEVVTLMQLDILKAFSVGFNARKIEEDLDDRSAPTRITEAELIEISIVSVPCNMAALAEVAASKGLTLKHIISSGIEDDKGDNKVDPDKLKDEIKTVVDPAIKSVADDAKEAKATAGELRTEIAALAKITNDLKDASQNGTKSSGELREQIDRMEADTKKAVEELSGKVNKIVESKRTFPFGGSGETMSLKSLHKKSRPELKSLFPSNLGYIDQVEEFQRRSDDLLLIDTMLDLSSEKHAGSYHRMSPVERIKSLKSWNELNEFTKAMDIATATEGAEWIPTEFSAQMEDKVRLAFLVAPLFRQISMPQSPYTLPVHLTDTEATLAAEKATVVAAFDSTEETPGTGKVTFTAVKARSRIQISAELTEDSIIPMLPYITENAVRGIAGATDEAIVNGDNGTTHFDTGYTVAATDFRRGWDGLRYHFQTTLKSTHGIDLSTFTEDNLRSVRAEMGIYGMYPSQLAWLMSAKCYLKKFLRNLDDVLTVDKYGPQAVVLTGELAKFDGAPNIITEYIADNLDDDGIYSAAGQTKSEVLCVNRNSWALGSYRPLSVASEKDIINDVFTIVAFKRMDFQPLVVPTATTGVTVNSGYKVTY